MASDEHEDLWEILGKMPFVIWFCPSNREHKRNRNRDAGLRPTVEWIDGVAHCLEPGCGKKSTDPKEELMSGKTLTEMTTEVRVVNIEKGWREPGKTYGDYIALLHSEVAEALESFRQAGLADLTGKIQAAFDGVGLENQPVKPEGVGSELADVLIRLLDTCDVIGLKRDEQPRGRGRGRGRGQSTEVEDPTLADVRTISQMEAMQRGQIPGPMISFGDHTAWLDHCISKMWMDPEEADSLLSALVTVAQKFGFDLMAEYERKMSFNRTREFRHGGKLL